MASCDSSLVMMSRIGLGVQVRPDIAITVVLPLVYSEIVDMFVEMGRFNSRSVALS